MKPDLQEVQVQRALPDLRGLPVLQERLARREAQGMLVLRDKWALRVQRLPLVPQASRVPLEGQVSRVTRVLQVKLGRLEVLVPQEEWGR